jgi:hypothetical protein
MRVDITTTTPSPPGEGRGEDQVANYRFQ